jgi:transcriptional regulator with XRE-family HTH domain
MHTRYWQKLEAGEANPTADTLDAVCRALGVTLSELFAGSDRGALG